MRMLIGKMLGVTVLRFTGWRFSKEWRVGVRWYHRTINAYVSTVAANIAAESTGGGK